MPFGPAEFNRQTAQTFGEYQAEYSAMRSRVGVVHLPSRVVLDLRGQDRQDYLHRLMTQDINGMTGGMTRRAFQLSEKGRVLADALVHHGDENTWLELDTFDAPAMLALLEERLFTEDVQIADRSDDHEMLWLLGPAAGRLLQAICTEDASLSTPTAAMTMPGTHHVLMLEGQPTTVYRYDLGSILGVRLVPTQSHAPNLYAALLHAAGYDARAELNDDFAQQRRDSLRGRPVGWAAFNTARIEEHVPMFHIDFGTDAIPNETGLLDEAVSFTAGCYLGQEVVVRIKDLGHPKRVIVPLKFNTDDLPFAGAQLFTSDQKLVGGITSSTHSPLRGQAPIGLGLVKWAHRQPGTVLQTTVEQDMIEAVVEAS